ncbi:hypothetical protein [Streptomyces sp. MUM 178J]|uniref:hypothetical protein n=1 Tax=Streptomyces sp. MUM 178J TaxID=2791991 RepID=UPI001F04EB14|nr:hypothetical protein [Streptomyces sp. MUM 178J]WRQ78666.1 hypothetical protein I3F59_004315 [Streptomyces sp. MUM 178J]
MAGFRSLARQVRDTRCDLALRRYSLRKCLERFAPYGHRATWDHLCTRHGFGPEDRQPDPARLVAALEELEEARAVWLAYEKNFAVRRRREKHAGLRRPGFVDDWHRRTWGGNGIARCDSPADHPKAPLGEVLRRLTAALEAEPGAACPVCGGTDVVWRQDLSCEPSFGPVCTGCGIVVPQPVLTREAVDAAKRAATRGTTPDMRGTARGERADRGPRGTQGALASVA